MQIVIGYQYFQNVHQLLSGIGSLRILNQVIQHLSRIVELFCHNGFQDILFRFEMMVNRAFGHPKFIDNIL
ncbi:hypothetical protein D3C80_1338600 [compost metagenome]